MGSERPALKSVVIMPEMNFPSGPWTGFYNYRAGGGRHRMDLSLTFADGRISGGGSDDVARFAIAGGYDSGSGECHWTKSYFGAHTVFYRGFREGKGIWGLWEIMYISGGFHIWPLGEEEAEQKTEAVSEPLLLKAVAPRGT